MPKKIKKRSRAKKSELESTEIVDAEFEGDEVVDAEFDEDGEDHDAEDSDDEIADAEFDEDGEPAAHHFADDLLSEVPARERDSFQAASYQAASWAEKNASLLFGGIVAAIVLGLAGLGFAQWREQAAVSDSAKLNGAVLAYGHVVEGSLKEKAFRQIHKDWEPKNPYKSDKARWEAVYKEANASASAHSGSALGSSSNLAKAAAAYRLGKWDEAISAYESALKAPYNTHIKPFARYGLALSYFGKKDLAKASETLDKLADDKSFGPIASYQKARMYDLEGKTKEAKEAYHKALETHPKTPFKADIERRISKLGS